MNESALTGAVIFVHWNNFCWLELKAMSMFMRFLVVCVIIMSCASIVFAYTYELSVCAIFRNEARFLKEWIEFHKIIGVQHFFLYNHMSTDNYKTVLEPYIESGIVELTEWTDERPHYQWQMAAYQDALQKARGVTRWLAVIDLDEFIVPIEHDSLLEFLKQYENFGGVCINWLMFGTSHISKIASHELMTEKLVMCQIGCHEHVKSIIQPDTVISMLSAHHAQYLPDYYQVTPEKTEFSGQTNPNGSIDKIRINHYWTQDAYFCVTTKISRVANCYVDGDDYVKKLELIKFVIDQNNIYCQQKDFAIYKYMGTLKLAMRQQVFVSA